MMGMGYLASPVVLNSRRERILNWLTVKPMSMNARTQATLPYSSNPFGKAAKSQQALQDTGILEAVQLAPDPGPAPQRTASSASKG